jgi:YVTN family beta-propeller protein
MIDGNNGNLATFIAVGGGASAVALNPVTNQIYVTNFDSGNVTVIDGATSVVTATLAASGGALAINPVTNKIYLASNSGIGDVVIIDGATNTSTAVPAGSLPIALAVDVATNRVYVANNSGNDVTVLTEEEINPIPLTATVTALSNNQTASRTPSFDFTAISQYSPVAPAPQATCFQVDTWQGPWITAGGTNPNFSGKTGTLSLGPHVLYAFAVDGQAGNINGNFGNNGQVILGAMAAYPFTVVRADTTTSLGVSPNPSGLSQIVVLTAGIAVVPPGMGAPTGIVTFFDGSNSLGTASLNSGLQATLQTSALGLGTHSLTAQYTGDTNFTASISAAVVLTTQAQDFSLVASALTPTSVTAGRTASSQLTVASLYGFNGAVLLACSVSPKPSLAPTCTVNPASLTPPGDGSPAASMLTIGTTGATAALAQSVVWRDGGGLRLLWLPIPALAFLAAGLGSRRPWRNRLLSLLATCLLFAVMACQAGCGSGSHGSGSAGNPGTPADSYTVTVTAISGSLTHTASLTLTVN